ncbi:hypothetical protein GWK47_010835 [Chionoecetes opilio]|uniref:Uncharacterized protein n=1 Tax=Chionoecetes opilio TaxID=41210 RepID=A0A8J4XX89_CHIOP|nr:hypothetical protein GWK47_010835 [Chionoecetes opilio]
MARLSTKRAAGKGVAVLGRVAKTPAGLALAWSRAVRFNRVVDAGNINAIREILPFESDLGNVGKGLTAAPGWDGVAINCNGIIILCQKVEEDIRALGPFGVIDWAKMRGDGNCSSAGVKSYVGRDAGVAIEVFKVEQCISLCLGVNSHQAGPVGAGTECNLANLRLEACRETQRPMWNSNLGALFPNTHRIPGGLPELMPLKLCSAVTASSRVLKKRSLQMKIRTGRHKMRRILWQKRGYQRNCPDV